MVYPDRRRSVANTGMTTPCCNPTGPNTNDTWTGSGTRFRCSASRPGTSVRKLMRPLADDIVDAVNIDIPPFPRRIERE
jgi:hypothetical protein